MKKWAVAIVAILILAMAAVVVAIKLDMQAVEARAMECEGQIPLLLGFRSRFGEYPDISEVDSISPSLHRLCNYISQGTSFSMGLTGGDINMQMYVYDSVTAEWHWD
jgi:hypothetical protein